MKISQMLKREDFYAINQNTLDSFFCNNDNDKTELYIYPQLNAIVTAKPSASVVNYLLCEYSVRGNKMKQLATHAYVLACMKSAGILSARKCIVKTKLNPSLLIYPCNKKYRIFDFSEKTVVVTAKAGFSDSDLQHEIEFRKRTDLPEFVPRFISYDKKSYKERIIDGCPLARITDDFAGYRDKAYQQLIQFGESEKRQVSAKDYTVELSEEIQQLLTQKADNAEEVRHVVKKLLSKIEEEDVVTLTFSHGDLQAGNIWVENETKKIFIIDWESWGIRSSWYDRATLFQGLRPGEIQRYLTGKKLNLECAVVLLEDIVFRLHELNSLPENFGINLFRAYCTGILQWLNLGGYNGE